MWACEAREMEPARLRAWLIRTLSLRSACQDSDSEEELLPLSGGVLISATCIMWSEERLERFAGSIVRSGDCSVSEEERFVMVGGGGEPSDFLERNPAWKRFALGLISIEGSGAVGIGDEP